MAIFQGYEKIIIDESETRRAKELLRGYGNKLKDFVYEKKGEAELAAEGGNFWDPVDQHGIYLVIEKEKGRNLVQIAGGLSPLLFAINDIYPGRYEKIIGMDIEPYYKEEFGYIGLGYELVCEDAEKMSRLKLEIPCIVFSYHFLDFTYFRNDHCAEENLNGQKKVNDIIGNIIDALPERSVLISQPINSRSGPNNYGEKKIEITPENVEECLEDCNNVEGFLWTELNRRKKLNNKLIITMNPENPRTADAVVFVSRIC